MPTYPLPTLAPTVDVTGISAPSYQDIYQSLLASFRAIYGSDVYVDPDSQDGQWIAVLAAALHESNQAAVSVFQSFSPVYAQGVGLSGLVRLNGLTRNIATNGTLVGRVVGVAGTIITNGIVQDSLGNQWALPASVTVPPAGELLVTATALAKGSILAPVGSVNEIYNPQLGWQSFSNTSAAIPGAPVETDAQLRIRQANSSSLPALDTRESIYSAVANVSGVTSVAVYDNDTNLVDINGVPGHSICVVVAGGDVSAVALAIANKKPPGAPTYGTTTVTVFDDYGLPSVINFMVMSPVDVHYGVIVRPLAGYTAATGRAIQQALMDFANNQPVGGDIYLSQALAVASLLTTGMAFTFNIQALYLGPDASTLTPADMLVPFNRKAICSSIGNVQLSVTT